MKKYFALSALCMMQGSANEMTAITGVTVYANLKCGYCLQVQNAKWAYKTDKFSEYGGYASRGASNAEGACCIDHNTLDASGGSASICAAMLSSSTAAKTGYSFLEKNSAGSYISAIAACPFYQDTCSTLKGSKVTSVISTTAQSISLETIGDSVSL